MKFIVATQVRVGSTWVCSALKELLGVKHRHKYITTDDHELGTAISDKHAKLIQEVDYPIVKTHEFAPVDLLSLLGDDTYVVLVKRNLEDTLVSALLYEYNVRIPAGEYISSGTQALYNQFPTITDDAWCNLIVEAQTTRIRDFIRTWRIMQHSVSHPNVIVVNYDKLTGNPTALVRLLNKTVRADSTKVKNAVSYCNFSSMKQRHPDGFVRRGVVNDSRNYLDDQSKNWIRRETKIITQKRISEL